jgi:hypothetical protein
MEQMSPEGLNLVKATTQASILPIRFGTATLKTKLLMMLVSMRVLSKTPIPELIRHITTRRFLTPGLSFQMVQRRATILAREYTATTGSAIRNAHRSIRIVVRLWFGAGEKPGQLVRPTNIAPFHPRNLAEVDTLKESVSRDR